MDMSTSIEIELDYILWNGLNIDSEENQKIYYLYLKDFNAARFKNYEEIFDYLTQYLDNKWAILTSASRGEKLRLILSNSLKLINLIFFMPKANFKANLNKNIISKKTPDLYIISFDTHHHKSSNNSQNDKDMNKESIIKEIHEIKKESYSKSNKLLEIEFDYIPKIIDEKVIISYYYVVQDIFKIQFMNVLKSLNKSEVIEKELIINELQRISHNCVWKSIEDKLTAEEDILKSFIFLYSNNYFYNEFNLCFSKLEYDKLKYTTAGIFQQLKNRPQLHLKPLSVLYRGVLYLDTNQFIIGRELYWPAFTSTTIDKRVAQKRYAGDDGFVFHITLLPSNPHPHIFLPEEWSAHKSEKEVLLLPYFAFIITNIKGKTIKIIQNEKKAALPLDIQQISNSINEIINRELNTAIITVINQSKNECWALNLDNYFICKLINDIRSILRNKAGLQIIKIFHGVKFNELDILFIKRSIKKIKGRIDGWIIERFKQLYYRLQQGIINIIGEKFWHCNEFSEESIDKFLKKIIKKLSKNIRETNSVAIFTNKLKQWYKSTVNLIKKKKALTIDNAIEKIINIIKYDILHEVKEYCENIKIDILKN